jgi:hypothetical protein
MADPIEPTGNALVFDTVRSGGLGDVELTVRHHCHLRGVDYRCQASITCSPSRTAPVDV